jgi:hypothetical protein
MPALATARAAESNGLLVEEEIDVDRLIRLAVSAVLGLRDEPHNRGVALGERRLVREVGRRARHHDEGERRNEDVEQGARACGHVRDCSTAVAGPGYGSGSDANRSNPNRLKLDERVTRTADSPDARIGLEFHGQ